MGRVAVEVVVFGIREESRVLIVDMTLDGVPQRFRFERESSVGWEPWTPGPGPYPIRQDAKFVEAFKASKGRSEIVGLIERWDRGERIDLPVHFTTTRRA